MRRLRVICVFVTLIILAGCAAQAVEPSSAASQAKGVSQQDFATKSQPKSEVTAIPDVPAELKEQGVITVYRKYPDSDVFESTEISTSSNNVTLLDVIKAAESVLDVELPILSITQQKGMVVINLAHELLNTYSKRELYPILTTVGVTLRENHRGFEWLQYQVDGEVGLLGEKYELPTLKLVEGSAEEYAAIRALIPYEGLIYDDEGISLIELDDTGRKILRFLDLLENINKDVSSQAELDNQYIIETSLYSTQHYTVDVLDKDMPNYRKELLPLQGPVSEKLGLHETWFWLKEHVEESAKLIFGDEIEIRHESLKSIPYRYLETEGVYTPPHIGMMGLTVPCLIDYEDLGDSYRVKMAFLLGSFEGTEYLDPDTEDYTEIKAKDVNDYVRDKSRHREIVLKKMEDGSLRFVSHRYL